LFSLFLLQPCAALSLLQQDFSFPPFFFFPPSANEAVANNKPAVANKNTFLSYKILVVF